MMLCLIGAVVGLYLAFAGGKFVEGSSLMIYFCILFLLIVYTENKRPVFIEEDDEEIERIARYTILTVIGNDKFGPHISDREINMLVHGFVAGYKKRSEEESLEHSRTYS